MDGGKLFRTDFLRKGVLCLTEVQRGNKRDITEKVSAKFESGRLVFYHNHEPIGEMDLGTKEIQMNVGYFMENNLILASDNKTELQDHYTENCDTGWC
jgi:hypothetical protein